MLEVSVLDIRHESCHMMGLPAYFTNLVYFQYDVRPSVSVAVCLSVLATQCQSTIIDPCQITQRYHVGIALLTIRLATLRH